jgi:hypothetical protein
MSQAAATNTFQKQIWDGSYVLICLICFEMIANAVDVLTLDNDGTVHVCKEPFLAERVVST